MYRVSIILLLIISFVRVTGQTLFVDPVNGQKHARGIIDDPISDLADAVARASDFSGDEPITIKLAPGLYLLSDQLVLAPLKKLPDTIHYTIEAMTNPDAPDWVPVKMPVIQSVSANNKNWGNFDHCAGIQVQRNNVCLRGIKFVGNTNPGVVYYYPVERHFQELSGLMISQCLFVGNRSSAPIQGAVFAQGKNIKIEHTVFYQCKNAVLCFMNVSGFALTYSIIYGSYEAAIMFGKYSDFVFSNNVIANNNCFWVSIKDYTSHYVFSNSVITDNKVFMGLNGDTIEVDKRTMPVMHHVQRFGKVELNGACKDTLLRNYLQLSAASAGQHTNAGIFRINGL